MDAGDLIFYGLIAISAIASIVKSTKKKVVSSEESSLPDFKGDVARKIIKTILEEDDDYIPSNPKPPVNREVLKPKLQPEIVKKSTVETKSYGKWYDTEGSSGERVDAESKVNLETYHRINDSLEKPINEINNDRQKSQSVRNVFKSGNGKQVKENDIDLPESIIDPLSDFKDFDEVKKALVYGEIMKTKF
jgi:hypothetical protein